MLKETLYQKKREKLGRLPQEEQLSSGNQRTRNAGENVGKESHLVTDGRKANVIANMEITDGGSSKTEN